MVLSMRASLLFALLLSLAATAGAATPSPEPSPDGLPQRLVLALDGIPHDVFADLQARGHFADFRPARRMVSSFPSLSAVSFAAIAGSEPPPGYQMLRYDPASNRVVGNTLLALAKRSHMNLPADSSGHSSLHRVAGYLSPYGTSVRDLRQVGRELFASDKASFVGYVGQTDVLLHLDGRAGAERFLIELERRLQDWQAEMHRRTGRGLLVDIVSDHGSTQGSGKAVMLERQLRRCGFDRRNRIEDGNDVAYTLAGLIGSVAVATRPESVEAVARCLAGTDGVELVALDRGERVAVLAADGGEAELWPEDPAETAYLYRNLRGDPLQLLDAATAAGAGAAGPHRISATDAFASTLDGPYPAALRRLWQAFHGSVREPNPILLSLQDGRVAGDRAMRVLGRLRVRGGTHGSLGRDASLGVLASNWRDVADVDVDGANRLLFGAATLTAMREQAGAMPALGAPAAGSGAGELHPDRGVVARPVP